MKGSGNPSMICSVFPTHINPFKITNKNIELSKQCLKKLLRGYPNTLCPEKQYANKLSNGG